MKAAFYWDIVVLDIDTPEFRLHKLNYFETKLEAMRFKKLFTGIDGITATYRRAGIYNPDNILDVGGPC